MGVDTKMLPALCPTLEAVTLDTDSSRKRLMVLQRRQIPPTYQEIRSFIFPGRMLASLPPPTRLCPVRLCVPLAAFTSAQTMAGTSAFFV